jgi:hypothetical protein
MCVVATAVHEAVYQGNGFGFIVETFRSTDPIHVSLQTLEAFVAFFLGKVLRLAVLAQDTSASSCDIISDVLTGHRPHLFDGVVMWRLACFRNAPIVLIVSRAIPSSSIVRVALQMDAAIVLMMDRAK